MTISLFDIALPIALGAIFALHRYSQRVRSNPENAVSQSILDGVKGAAGLAVILFVYEFISAQ